MNFENDPPIHQPPGPSHQSNVPLKNPQFENDKIIFELKSDRILKDPYQVQVSEANTDASQSVNLEKEVSTEANPIEEPESKIVTNLNDKKKRVDELLEIYKPRILFSSVLKVGSSTLELPPQIGRAHV